MFSDLNLAGGLTGLQGAGGKAMDLGNDPEEGDAHGTVPAGHDLGSP